jgi:lipopolysaccharide transport system permease protein
MSGTPPRSSQTFVYDAATPERWQRSINDIRDGFGRWRLAWALARSDVMHRYRGSVLGPFWLTMSTAVMLGALGFLYAQLFRIPIDDYLPWLAASLIIWNIIAGISGDACTALTSAEGILRQMPLPSSVQALRTVMRNALVAAHHIPLIFIVFLIFGITPSWRIFLALPGFALLAFDAFWASLLLGMLCARFRDVPPIVASIVQVAFFITPVMWKPELAGHLVSYLPLNPMYAVMETIRGPLLGTEVPTVVWIFALGYSAGLAVVAQFFFMRFRERIAFWV